MHKSYLISIEFNNSTYGNKILKSISAKDCSEEYINPNKSNHRSALETELNGMWLV